MLPLFLNVLEVNCRNDGDACLEELFRVLPAMEVTTARGIIVGEAVHQTHLRSPSQNGFDIHHGCTVDHPKRDDFHLLQQVADFGRELELGGSHKHVFPSLATPPAFLQHTKRLAHARGVTQENLQPAAPHLQFFGLHPT